MARRGLLVRFALVAALGAGVLAYVACTSGSPATTPSAGDGSAPGVDGAAPVEGGNGFDGSLASYIDAAGGGPCEASTDCPPLLLCLYPVDGGCSATPVCAALPAAECGGPYCTCRGDTAAACGAYAELPVIYPLHGSPCAAPPADSGTDAGEGHD